MINLCCGRREEESGCSVKTCPLVVRKKPHWAPICGTDKLHHPFLRTRQRTGTTWHALWYNRINSTDYLVAKDTNTRRRCSPKLHKNYYSERRERKKKSRTSSMEPVTCCTVCFVRRHINTLSQAGLHPQLLRHRVDRTEEITERQSALAHSVRRVYMTMLKWGDF